MNTHIRHDHQELLASRVGGKLPRNLSWDAVIDLIGQIGEVQPHGSLRKVFAVSSLGPCKRLELGTVLRRDGSLCYGGAARSNLSLSSDATSWA